MSIVGARAAIAARLSEVDGVTGYAYRPGTPTTGDAWVLLGPVERDTRSGQFMITWRVLVSLPADEYVASDWIDGHLESLWDALEPVGYIDSFEPVVSAASGNDTRFLQITMRSE